MRMEPDKLVVRTRGLARLFGETAAVSVLDLDVRKGEMFGLVGPDGAGKSTAIRLLCGILKPTSGEGMVLGHDLAREPEKIKGRIGYLSQNFTLYGDLTVDENIEFFADIHGVADLRSRRNELLDFTRLTPFRTRLARALSGGMKKKLALACTLVHTPDLVFLDEPSTGVDPVSRGEFWNILSDILEQGVTIFMTSPYLDEVERCHRISLINRGHTLMSGTPAEVKAALPGCIYNIQCASPAAAYSILRARWSPERLVLYGSRLHMWSQNGRPEAMEAVAMLESRGMGPASLLEVKPSLEDALIGLVSSREPTGDRK
ncbi:MAG: ABC transporter ATP-binding protein [bacterium]